MSRQTDHLISELKVVLRAQKITYKDVAERLEISEASVKRLFSRGPFTLDRLEQVCDLAGIRIAELAARIEARPPRVTELTQQQEKELLADEHLLLVTFMILNHWSLERIVEVFAIDHHSVIRKLAQLDRMGFIDLMPDNRIRLRISRHFSWRKDGPMQRYFESQVRKNFLDSRFAGPEDHLRFVGGLISRDSIARLHRHLDRVCEELDDCIQADADLPASKKVGIGAVLGLRPWELPAFTRLRRKP